MDVTAIVATYGDRDVWDPLAERALASINEQDPAPTAVIRHHGETLHGCRNEAVAQVETEWVCLVDADDELAPGYFRAMEHRGADLRAPWVRYIIKGRPTPEQIPRGTADLTDGNRMVIGTLVRREMFLAAGGFRDWPFYEDWDLWQRCWRLGATVEFVRQAVYCAHVRRDSRNRTPTHDEKLAVHHAIRRSNFPELYETGVGA